jgi:hypothetical protein
VAKNILQAIDPIGVEEPSHPVQRPVLQEALDDDRGMRVDIERFRSAVPEQRVEAGGNDHAKDPSTRDVRRHGQTFAARAPDPLSIRRACAQGLQGKQESGRVA